ncbi:hypothetical protein BDZ89DRAFT_1070254 [Hymenopellis radicata]|nr:hypothetical protein BDZ89DRAFT_1070254 [Hymenopellis radicata]
MSTNLGNGLPDELPLELINEIIACNQDDIAFLRSASLVSKIWRAAALRYLFSEASFLCKNDFIRWTLICSSLPHVAQYVRKVVVDLGETERLQERAKSAPTGFIARAIEAAGPYYPYTESLAVDCTFPKDSDFVVILPTMGNATRLDWTMPSPEAGFKLTAANTTHFLTSFPNITDLSYSSNRQAPPIFHAQFMSFYQNLRNVRAGSMDWLPDNVLHNSTSPIHLRKLGWESGDPPFSSNSFARLVRMAHGTLEELCFRPPWTPAGTSGGLRSPSVWLECFTCLADSSFRIFNIYLESESSMQWLNSIFAVFPSCPCLQRLEFAFYLAYSIEIDSVFAFGFLDWNSLLEDRYPSLKVLEFEMMMADEDEFDIAERQHLETIIRQSTELVNSDKFVMRWSPAR